MPTVVTHAVAAAAIAPALPPPLERRSGGPLAPQAVRDADAAMNPHYQRIYAVIAAIPEGRVATYGQVAAYAGLPNHARLVGYALRHTPEGLDLPWHRVVNAQGEISARAETGPEEGYQRHLLLEEGVVFRSSGRIDLRRFGWRGEAADVGSRAGRDV